MSDVHDKLNELSLQLSLAHTDGDADPNAVNICEAHSLLKLYH